MKYTEKEVLQFIEENDVKFVKLMFCDIFGNLKTVSIISRELARAFREGIPFDASKDAAFMNITDGDLRLVPDLDTLSLLPWRPQQGRVVRFFCNIKNADGTAWEGDGRFFLKTATEYARSKGYLFQIGTSCEFYIFETDDNGFPKKVPHDYAGYCDAAPMDKGENLRREICLTLEQMDIYPESSNHERGPGQNEIDFQYSNALNAADNLITFKNVVKTIAARNGLHASFMPKPYADKSGSGLHLSISCVKGLDNIFATNGDKLSAEAESMIAGLLKRVPDMELILNPITNSYARLGDLRAPKYLTWSHQNHAQLLKIPMGTSESKIILRSPDNSCNPYFAMGLVIYACLDGMAENMTLCEPVDLDLSKVVPSQLEGIQKLPATLGEAISICASSNFIAERLPEKVMNYFIDAKTLVWEEYSNAEEKEIFETVKYFYTL